jgi:carboxyl-terminal processing protease
MTVTKRIKSALLIMAIIATALLLAQTRPADCADKADYKELKLFRDVMGIVQKHYVKDVEDKELVQGAINGMLQSLDPNSQYLSEDMLKELNSNTKEKFGDLGIKMTLENGVLTVVSPIEDTPASKAGLKSGDKILKIDGETTKNISLLKAEKQMRGRPGTKVTLTIMREGFKEFKDYTIERAIIHPPSVKTQTLEKGYPYIRIAGFQEGTDAELANAIKDLGEDESIKGMVLDLRSNPGSLRDSPDGLLDQAWKVANLFLEKGALIVYTRGRTKDPQMEFKAKPGKHYKFRMAVLINEGTAGASEIVAGALQDNDRALIFGSKSFGTAAAWEVRQLDNKSGITLTTAYYFTPNGQKIQGTGIKPDADNRESETATQQSGRTRVLPLKQDPVVLKALEWLKSGVTVSEYKRTSHKQASH